MIKSGNALHATINRYVHPATGNQVEVVGMVHYADASYYERMQSYLDGRAQAGAHIQYEGTRPLEPGERPGLGALVKTAILGVATGGTRRYFEDNFTSQKDALQIRPTWENTDMSTVELFKRMDWWTVMKYAVASGAVNQMFSCIPGPMRRSVLLMALEDKDPQKSNSRIAKRIGRFVTDLSNKTDEAMVNDRNEIALKALRRSQRGRRNAQGIMVWGEGHLPGIGAGLSRDGYQLKDQLRVRAIELPASKPQAARGAAPHSPATRTPARRAPQPAARPVAASPRYATPTRRATTGPTAAERAAAKVW